MCARLIAGEEDLLDRPVAAGDIALLAPTGTELAIYERALEDRGIAVVSQAGSPFTTRGVGSRRRSLGIGRASPPCSARDPYPAA